MRLSDCTHAADFFVGILGYLGETPLWLRRQIATRRKHLSELDEHDSELFASETKMLRMRAGAALVLDHLIVDDADAMTSENG
jgi:hypothetical protein